MDREIYVVRVIKRMNGVYFAVPLAPAPDYFEPFSENGIDVFDRNDEWQDVIKVVWEWLPTDDERGRILRVLRNTHYPTAVYREHRKGANE